MDVHIANLQIEERRRYFRIVRDIPFYIATGDEQGYSCTTKRVVLSKLLSTVGLQSRHMLCTFKWEKLELPRRILALPHNETEMHGFLIVHIPETESWVRVDPTWDSRIRNPHLPIAEWDGIHDTSLAVPAEKIFSPEETEKIDAEEATREESSRSEYLNRNREFFRAFNRWLESQRVKL